MSKEEDIMEAFKPFINAITQTGAALAVTRMALKSIIRECEGQSDLAGIREIAENALTSCNKIMDYDLG